MSRKLQQSRYHATLGSPAPTSIRQIIGLDLKFSWYETRGGVGSYAASWQDFPWGDGLMDFWELTDFDKKSRSIIKREDFSRIEYGDDDWGWVIENQEFPNLPAYKVAGKSSEFYDSKGLPPVPATLVKVNP